MEKYLAAAEQIAKKAIDADPLPKPALERYRPEQTRKILTTADLQHDFRVEGDYDLRAQIARVGIAIQSSSTIPHVITVYLDGEPVVTNRTDTDPDRRKPAERRIHIPAGPHTVRATVAGATCRRNLSCAST